MTASRARRPTALPVPDVPAEPRERRTPLRGLGAIAATCAVHGVIAYVLLSGASTPTPARKATPIEVVVTRPKPPPPPPEAPPPPKPEPEPPAPKAKPPPPMEAKAKPPPKAEPPTPPPPNEAAPKPQAPVPVKVGLSMSSTTATGAFAAAVGNTMYGETGAKAADPTTVKPLGGEPGGKYVPPHKLAKRPKVLKVPVLDYPPEAKKLEIEGTVVLLVTVDAKGGVSKVKVLKGLGHGLDEVAVKALTLARFEPGTDGEGPVATDITYNYIFELTN